MKLFANQGERRDKDYHCKYWVTECYRKHENETAFLCSV